MGFLKFEINTLKRAIPIKTFIIGTDKPGIGINITAKFGTNEINTANAWSGDMNNIRKAK